MLAFDLAYQITGNGLCNALDSVMDLIEYFHFALIFVMYYMVADVSHLYLYLD